MLERANRNKEKAKADNVSFTESMITDIALPDATANCIISNCVVNLVPEAEKQLVFNEMFRLLKPGGRVAISDILSKKELPQMLKKSMALYVGCIAGASQVKDYEKYLREAGFGGKYPEALFYRQIAPIALSFRFSDLEFVGGADILIVDAKKDLNVYIRAEEDGKSSPCCVPGGENACCEKSSCCNVKESAVDNFSESFKVDFKDVDFNDLAGVCAIFFS